MRRRLSILFVATAFFGGDPTPADQRAAAPVAVSPAARPPAPSAPISSISSSPVAPGAAPSGPHGAPPSVERWLFNARERTRRGIGSFDESRLEAAASAFDTAARLRPGDPLTAFNAGTGRLAAGLPEAVPLLEKAARSASAGLAPQAWYNLGEARLKAGDAAGAVEAYKETLRRESAFAEAKHNLELALRQLEQQKKEQERSPEGKNEQQEKQDKKGDEGGESKQENSTPESNPQGGDQDQEEQPADEAQRENPRPQESGEEQNEPENAGGSTGESDPEAQASDPQSENKLNPGGSQPPLPHFRDLPEMTAGEAAAILAAVENLEREQRRAAALAQAALRARVEKDW